MSVRGKQRRIKMSQFPENIIATATSRQAGWLEDIALSLKIISGRTSLREERLQRELDSLYRSLDWTEDKVKIKEIRKKIDEIEKEIEQDRIKREGKYIKN